LDATLTEPVQKDKQILVGSIVAREIRELGTDGRGLWGRLYPWRRRGCEEMHVYLEEAWIIIFCSNKSYPTRRDETSISYMLARLM